MALAPSPNRLAGVATMSIDGQTYMVVSGTKWKVSDMNVETLKGQDGVHGTKEMPEPGMIGAKLRDSGKVSVSSLAANRNSSVVLSLANGKQVVGNNMWRVGEVPEVDSEDGSFDIQFEGPDVSEN